MYGKLFSILDLLKIVYKSFNYLTESVKLLFVDKELSKNYIILQWELYSYVSSQLMVFDRIYRIEMPSGER